MFKVHDEMKEAAIDQSIENCKAKRLNPTQQKRILPYKLFYKISIFKQRAKETLAKDIKYLS